MENEIKKRINELQETEVVNESVKKQVKDEIIKIIKECSAEDIKELLDNKAIVHSIVIQKGGVGKSTLSSDLCYTLAKMGFKVLGIDSDPQASFTMLMNINTEDEEMYGLQDLYDEYLDSISKQEQLEYSKIEKAIVRPTFVKPAKDKDNKWKAMEFEFGFDFIPANLDLAGYDIYLAKPGHAIILRNIVQRIIQNNNYDFIIIDSLPGLNAISYNVIGASDSCIVPINLEPMTVKGAKNLIGTVSTIQHLLWEKGILHKGILGIVKNQFAPRMKIQRKYEDVVKELFPISTFENSIPNRSMCDRAHAAGRLFSEYDPKTGEMIKEICYEILAEDIRRSKEKEPIYVDEIGVEVWEKQNEM